MAGLLFFTNQIFGQAANIDQIRNSLTYDNSTDPFWVNGNAGSSNSHYVEGHSIAYRTLLTGLTAGKTYSIVLSYDTKHSDRMALDYLTHYQRLQPHLPFGHPAEVINPLRMESGSVEYNMAASAPVTRLFPTPDPIPAGYYNNADNPSHGGQDDGTPVDNQPLNSFTNLDGGDPAKKVMTLYNGTFIDMNYTLQQTLTGADAQAETQIRIKFTASSDSVLFAWGGHIASRLDWGNLNGTPRSAGGISGSPYHMRLKQLFVYQGAKVGNKVCTSDSCEVGIGNQDRSLAAAAVIPPPECPSVPSLTQCLGSSSFVFTISNPDAGTTYTWSIGTNTAGGAFSGGINTGNSVTIVPSGSAFTAGSISLNITASKNGADIVCTGVATGTVVQVVATASADPTQIDLTSAAHSTTLTGGIDGTSTFTSTADYTFVWSIVTAGTLGTLTPSAIDPTKATYVANKLDPTSITFKVTATLTKTGQPACVDDAETTVTLAGPGVCDVSPQTAVCQGTKTTHNGSPDPKATTATYVWSLQAYGGGGTSTSTLDLVSTPNGGVQMKVNTVGSYRIVLTQTYDNPAFNTSCFEDVTVVPTPTVAATYVAPTTCGATTYSLQVTGVAGAPTVSTSSYRVTQTSITPAYDQSQNGNNGTLTFTGLKQGVGYTVTVTTGVAGCSATTTCGAANNRLVSDNRTTTSQTETVESFKIALEAPKTTESTIVRAVPNPFTDKVRFNMTSAISGTGSLELYNSVGQKVATVFTGHVQAGVELQKEFNVPVAQRNTLIYVFRVGNQKATGKLLRQ